MDIIIRNGVIQEKESKELYEIKNKAGCLKKNFDNYIPNSVGPYYDLKNCHICIPRKYNQIKNFIGPQDPYIIKLVEISNYNKKISYCCICHREMKSNLSFSGKRKLFIDDNYFEKKREIISYSNDIDDIENKIKKIKLIEDCNINNKESDIKMTFQNEINPYLIQQKHNNVVNKFYKIVYKLLRQPILYNLSLKESKLIWPWELTNYQKLRLKNPDYKSTYSFYSHQNNNRISKNYIVIE